MIYYLKTDLGKIVEKKFAVIITAPPAKFCLAGGFRTFSTFQGFGHGDSSVFF
jgi:hypothetical protein